jgi:hypothetical protein
MLPPPPLRDRNQPIFDFGMRPSARRVAHPLRFVQRVGIRCTLPFKKRDPTNLAQLLLVSSEEE